MEGRVRDKLGKAHAYPLKGLVDPAALYLTAILESVLFSYRLYFTRSLSFYLVDRSASTLLLPFTLPLSFQYL